MSELCLKFKIKNHNLEKYADLIKCLAIEEEALEFDESETSYMQANLSFHLPEAREEFLYAVHGSWAYAAIDDIWNRVFRPAYKHGYGGLHGKELNELLEKNDDSSSEEFVANDAQKTIDYLADIFREVIRDRPLDF